MTRVLSSGLPGNGSHLKVGRDPAPTVLPTQRRRYLAACLSPRHVPQTPHSVVLPKRAERYGNVIVEHLDDVIYMGRPTFGQANQQMSLFKVVEGGRFAERVIVRLGASSVNDIEVREGLRPGEVVILSDMSQWDGFNRVKLRSR